MHDADIMNDLQPPSRDAYTSLPRSGGEDTKYIWRSIIVLVGIVFVLSFLGVICALCAGPASIEFTDTQLLQSLRSKEYDEAVFATLLLSIPILLQIVLDHIEHVKQFEQEVRIVQGVESVSNASWIPFKRAVLVRSLTVELLFLVGLAGPALIDRILKCNPAWHNTRCRFFLFTNGIQNVFIIAGVSLRIIVLPGRYQQDDQLQPNLPLAAALICVYGLGQIFQMGTSTEGPPSLAISATYNVLQYSSLVFYLAILSRKNYRLICLKGRANWDAEDTIFASYSLATFVTIICIIVSAAVTSTDYNQLNLNNLGLMFDAYIAVGYVIALETASLQFARREESRSRLERVEISLDVKLLKARHELEKEKHEHKKDLLNRVFPAEVAQR